MFSFLTKASDLRIISFLFSVFLFETFSMENKENSDVTVVEKELNLPLHKVFVDLSLENDLKKEDMDWFRSRIFLEEKEVKEENIKTEPVLKKVEIITAKNLEKPEGKPGKLLLKLSETNTFWLLTLESSYSQEDAADAERVRKENETYEMKKTKIELIRKRCMADAQTPRRVEKSKETLTTEITLEDASVFASEWDLYDTYNNLDKYEMAANGKYFKCSDGNETDRRKLSVSLPLLSELSSGLQFNSEQPTEENLPGISKSLHFKYASLVAERLLASNCHQTEQLIFKKKVKTRYDEEPTLYSYKMDLLWNFKKDFQNPLMVTGMDWNPLNQDLLAVAYGDLDFQANSSGLICVWSPKNPRQPERQFFFEDSVTCLHYSKTRPNVLAVGTRSGNIFVIDVSSQNGAVRTLARDVSKIHAGPIWKVEWFPRKELIFESEELLTVGESGVLMLYSFSMEKNSAAVLELVYVTSTKRQPEGSALKKSSRRPFKEDLLFDKKIFSGLWFSVFSDGNLCYISTKEGVLVKCNLRNPSMTDGIFLVHNGPVYVIEHSPVTDLVYLTCGADWNIKIWMEGIEKPLITLQNKTPVMSARWSPTIPTLIASIGEMEVCLWDIARNVLSPISVKSFEGCEKPLTCVLFSLSGMNLVVGGQDGLVRVIHLSELPRIPFLQKEALIGAIRRGLIRNQDVIGEFQRAIEKNKDKLKTEVIV